MRRVAVTAFVTVVAGSLWLVVVCGPDGVRAQDAPGRLPPDSPHPTLLFEMREVPALRDKVRSDPVARGAFEQMRRRADGFLLVDTTSYVFHGAVAGRALTTQALNLAMAGYVTGDRRYLDKAAAIVCAAAGQSDVEDFAELNGALAVADAAHGYAMGYDWLYPFLTDEQRALIREEIRSFGEWLYEHSQTDFWGEDEPRRMAHNWNGVTHGGLGLAALALGDEQNWLDRAIERVRAYLEHSVDETGACYEGVSYMGYGLQNVVPMAVVLARQGGPDLLAEAPTVRLAPEYVLWQVLPGGGRIAPINQCAETLHPSAGVFRIISKFGDPIGLWGWLRLFGPDGDGTYGASSWLGGGCALPYAVLWADASVAPQSPADAGLPLSRFFARGQVSARDGWGPLDTLVTFTSGKGIPGIWNQGDENSFTFYSRGEQFAIDPGAGWGKTAEHNAILIDGEGQGSDGGPAAVQGKVVTAEDRGTSVYVLGDATAAYRARQPILRARRQLLFVRAPEPYLLIADDIQKDEAEHEYYWLLYSAEGNQLEIGPDGSSGYVQGAGRGARCQVRFLWPESDLSVEGTLARDKLPLLTATAAAVNPRFVVLLVAVDQGEEPPEVACQGAPPAMRIEIRFADGTQDALALVNDNIELTRTAGP